MSRMSLGRVIWDLLVKVLSMVIPYELVRQFIAAASSESTASRPIHPKPHAQAEQLAGGSEVQVAACQWCSQTAPCRLVGNTVVFSIGHSGLRLLAWV